MHMQNGVLVPYVLSSFVSLLYTYPPMKDENVRLLHERTLVQAKKEQKDSGFVSSNLYDNFVFCLALFRSKTHENVLEAKKMVEQLLYFQQNFNEVASLGNYPILISDFPYCQDHLQAFRISRVKRWILKEFHQILGQECKSRLEVALERQNRFFDRVRAEVKVPFWAKEPKDLSDFSDLRTWGDPEALAELILAYQLDPTDAWKPFWNYLSSVWHEPSGQYVGPAYKMHAAAPKFYAAMNLFSGRLDRITTYPLYGALLTGDHELVQKLLPHTLAGRNEKVSWTLHHEQAIAKSCLIGRQRPEEMPGFFPYYMAVGPHSLAIQAPFGYSTKELEFEIAPEAFLEEKEKAKALIISFTDHPQNKVLVGGHAATCFELKDSLEITLGGKKFALSFEKLSGDGQFVGHIVRGSRFGTRFAAGDIQIFLRALRGTTSCELCVHLLPSIALV